MQKKKKVLIVGLGYVGLTLAAVLLKKTLYKVYGLDSDNKKILSLKRGKSYILEPNIEKIIKRGIEIKSFNFATSFNEKFDIIIICVGTPIDKNKKIIEDYLIHACHQVRAYIRKNSLVIVRSTVKIGSTKNIVEKIIDKKNI